MTLTDNPFREVLCRQMGHRRMRGAWDGVACLRSGPVGDRRTLRLAVIPHLHPTNVGCRGRYCLHGVRYRERRFGRVRRHRGISGRVLLLRSKPDSQHCRDIGGGTFKR